MLADFFDRLSRRRKRTAAMAVDAVALPLALAAALVLKHGVLMQDWLQFWPAMAVAAAGVALLAQLGLYRHVTRHVGWQAVIAIGQGVTIIAVALLAVAFLVRLEDFPRSVPVIFWFLAFAYFAGTRFLVRFYAETAARRQAARKPVAIYGAGDAEAYLAYQLDRGSDFRPVAFIDDDSGRQGGVVQGLRVHPVEALGSLVSRYGIGQVLVAVPAAPTERRRIIERLEPYSVHVRLIPNIDAIVAESGRLTGVRDVEIGDLLGREEVAPLPHLLGGSVANRVVLVTGAGGSIGAELCRQIERLRPRMLVLLEQSEYALYRIEGELRRAKEREGLATQVVPILGSVLDRTLLERTMRGFGVQTVYHAAAYKHVHLVENNVIQGIRNNTFGTMRAAEAAIAAGVRDFILISTDKAVRTRNVMGASKRLAEMVLQAMQEETGICFSIVRFGNVLVSSGSVVPLFLEQIDKGGPVTVTHPDATRYFMTISEAAQLVLQAASMAGGGDVFLLDMGAPVNILELAKKIIRLRGYRVQDEATPDGDIAIEYTGLRPGEKLHEELLVGEALSGTEHRLIMRAVESHMPLDDLKPALANLENACNNFDYPAIKSFIEGLVEGADLAEQISHLPARANVLPMPR